MISDAAKVGIDTISINEVTSCAQTNKGVFISGRSGCFILRIVTTKLTPPRTEEMPSIFKPNIHISAAGPGARIIEYVGYAFHVTSAQPIQIRAAPTGTIQNATALSLGQAISWYLTMMGIK